MELKHIKGIGPSKQTKLNDAGVSTVEDLARADVEPLAEKTGISAATLRSYKESAVGLALLEDIKGVGPGTAKTLVEAGVASLRDLYSVSSDRLAKETKLAQERINVWQAEAKKLAVRVRDDAKTPEGRQKLVAEGKELAQKAAATTQTTVQDLLARAQKDGEAAIAKAQELRETAPATLQDYRKKAESALKDAEAQVRKLQDQAPAQVKELQAKAEAQVKVAQQKVAELSAKTQEFAKAEVEKAKAANEGFLKRFRAKIGPKN